METMKSRTEILHRPLATTDIGTSTQTTSCLYISLLSCVYDKDHMSALRLMLERYFITARITFTCIKKK